MIRGEALEILRKGTVIPAMPLVLDENRKFDEEGQRVLARYYLNAGVGGIAMAVHTTQFEIRDPQINLYEKVIEVVVDEIDKFEKKTGKTIVRIAGVCGEIEQAVKETKLSQKYGCDAVLLSPGGLNEKTEEYMVERTEKVAKIMPIVGFYLQPSVGGRVFSYEYWEKVCEIKNVVAIKAAPFNRYLTQDVVRAAALSSRADEIALYTGNDDNIIIDLITTYSFKKDGKTYKKDFVGGLLGHWSVWANTVVKYFDILKEAKRTNNITPEILSLANAVTDANSAFFDTANNFSGCIAGLHEVLRRQGLMKGIWCLNPDETVSPGQIEEIDRVYKMYPELNDDDFVKENIDKWR